MQQTNKINELTINISAKNRANIITNTTFFSMDVGTGQKIIHFRLDDQPLNLTDATVMLGFEFVDEQESKIIDSQDGSVIIENENAGRCRVILPNYLYDYEGRVLVHAYLTFPDGRSLDAGVIVTEFKKSWLDGELEEISKLYVKRFDDLAREIRERAEELHRLLDGIDANVVGRPDFNNHIENRNNPHGVTIGQIPNLQQELNHRLPVGGNAGSATVLQTPRTINGTNFNGSANITTANWGPTRNMTIGNAARSVNGAGNVSWTLADIGAAATNHSHSNFPSAITVRNLRIGSDGTGAITNNSGSLHLESMNNAVNVFSGTSITIDAGTNLHLNANSVRSSTIHDSTTSTSSNLNISTGTATQIRRVSSAQRYKLNINRGVQLNEAEKILTIEPATWFDKVNTEAFATSLTRQMNGDQVDFDDEGIERIRRIGGLIAEDIEKAGLETYVEYGPDGETPEGISYDRLWTLLIPLVRDQRQRIFELEAKLEKLEKKLEDRSNEN